MKMKAIVCTKYRPPENVPELKEVEEPTPKDNEVLVKVHAASVATANWAYVRGKPLMVCLMGQGLLKPKYRVIGSDMPAQRRPIRMPKTQF